jgi:hypothetical protein
MKPRRGITTHSRITIACFALLISTIVLYLYFLNMSVVQVVMRIEHVQHQRELSADIASLDAKFIETQHSISTKIATLDDSYNLDSDKIFVSREKPTLVMGGQ